MEGYARLGFQPRSSFREDYRSEMRGEKAIGVIIIALIATIARGERESLEQLAGRERSYRIVSPGFVDVDGSVSVVGEVWNLLSSF